MLPSRMLLDDFFDDLENSKKADKMMKCDIYESGDKNIIEMDMPGAKKEDITLDIEKGYLTITYKKNEDEVENDKKYIRRERHVYTNCSRQFYVGEVDESLVSASFKDGILSISMPKKEKETQKKTISIN